MLSVQDTVTINHLVNQDEWLELSKRRDLSLSFISTHRERLFWPYLLENYQFEPTFLLDNNDVVDWQIASRTQRLTDMLITLFSDRLNWDAICRFQYVSLHIMETFPNRINWVICSQCQNLSEETIDKYKTLIDWDLASKYQQMSMRFALNHFWQINWSEYLKQQNKRRSLEGTHKTNPDEYWSSGFNYGLQLLKSWGVPVFSVLALYTFLFYLYMIDAIHYF